MDENSIMNTIPTHIRAIINIINNYEFKYENNHVIATVDVYLDINELKDLIQEYQSKLNDQNISDADRQELIDAINQLNLAISELEK